MVDLPWWLSSKESACQCKRWGFDLWVRKIPWRRYGISLQYSCLGNPMERGTWPSTVHRVAKESETTLATKQQQQHVIVINVIPKVPLSLLLKVIQKNKLIFWGMLWENGKNTCIVQRIHLRVKGICVCVWIICIYFILNTHTHTCPRTQIQR